MMQVEKIHFSYNMNHNPDKPENALRKAMPKVPKLPKMPKIAASTRFIGVRCQVSGVRQLRCTILTPEH